jgi:hypothetical protein
MGLRRFNAIYLRTRLVNNTRSEQYQYQWLYEALVLMVCAKLLFSGP